MSCDGTAMGCPDAGLRMLFEASINTAASICASGERDRKSTRLNSSHRTISTLSLHDALPILRVEREQDFVGRREEPPFALRAGAVARQVVAAQDDVLRRHGDGLPRRRAENVV